MSITSPDLTPMEREALRLCISAVSDPARRAAMERQMAEVRVTQREYTGAGFYTYFSCPESLRSDLIPDNYIPNIALDHPARKECLFFLLYSDKGLLDFLEGASAPGMWYEEDAAPGCWPGTTEPVVFDPAITSLSEHQSE